MSDECGLPVRMKSGAPLVTDEAAAQKLAEKLRKEASPFTTADDLRTLSVSLDQKMTGQKVAHAFLQAGGVPTLIGHLGGASSAPTPSPSTHPDITAPPTANLQAAAIDALLQLKDALEDIATAVHPPLKDEFLNARLTTRCQAAYSLRALAIAEPGQLKVMAEAGVMVRLLDLYTDIGDLPLANLGPESNARFFADRIAALARLLVESRTIAVQDLKQAICGPSAVQTFAAIAILQVGMTVKGVPRGDLVGPLVDGGIVSALKHTLEHESPYCVAAAAGVLGMIGQDPGWGKAAIEASGAVAALVCILKRSPSPGDPKTETGLFRMTVFKVSIADETDRLHFRNPTAVAVAGLFATAPYSGPMLDSFVEAGGVPEVLRVLGESSCPLTTRYCLAVIQTLLGELHPPGTGSRSRELADELFRSGFCKAAPRALESGNKGVRKYTIWIMTTFLQSLSRHHDRAALAALVAGNAVEAVMRHSDDEGEDVHDSVYTLLMYFMTDPDGEKRMLAHDNVDEPMDGVEAGGLKDREGHLPSRMHGAGKSRADSQPPPSGAAAPGGRVGAGASPTCRAASRTSTCARCGVSSEELVGIGKLKECSGCRSVRYCGRACQMADWPAHKTMCKRKEQAAGK